MEHYLHYSLKILVHLLITTVSSEMHVVKYVTLNTRLGTLLGTHEIARTPFTSFDLRGEPCSRNVSYLAFRGVPYAVASRWSDPVIVPYITNDTFFNATFEKNLCPQWINGELMGDEDCLYASIFIPYVKKTNKTVPFKIMVYFHGGGFIVKSDQNKLPTPLLAQRNTIIVMFNYRISIFGYLSTGSSQLPGNYAFLDQIALLKWIQTYGADFSGNPYDITVFGSSIGSVSIHYLLLSKLSRGLFHKAIMESGSAFCERSLVPNPLEISQKLGSMLRCPTHHERELVNCLMSRSTFELMLAAKNLTLQWSLPSVLGPVIDRYSRSHWHQFLPDFPENLPVVNNVPVIVGITTEEGLNAFVKLSKNYTSKQLHSFYFIHSVVLPRYLDLIMRHRQVPSRYDYIHQLANETMYFYQRDFHTDPIRTLVEILGDIWINSCFTKTLDRLCANYSSSVYAYVFSHHDAGVSPSLIRRDVDQMQVHHRIFDYGVAHTEEILYLLEAEIDILNFKGNLQRSSTRNAIMSKYLSFIWTNFAVNGEVPMVIGWPTWNSSCTAAYDKRLFEISLDYHRSLPHYRLREAEFWWEKHRDTWRG